MYLLTSMGWERTTSGYVRNTCRQPHNDNNFITEIYYIFIVPEDNGRIQNSHQDFPGGPVVKTLHFHCRGTGSIPGR